MSIANAPTYAENYKFLPKMKLRHALLQTITQKSYFPPTIFLMPSNLFKASIGVKLLMLEMQYLIPNLAQHWVVQLEEAELHAVVCLHDLLCSTAVFITSLLLADSSSFNMVFARDTMLFGMPANLATWIPKECSLPPRSNLRRKMTF